MSRKVVTIGLEIFLLMIIFVAISSGYAFSKEEKAKYVVPYNSQIDHVRLIKGDLPAGIDSSSKRPKQWWVPKSMQGIDDGLHEEWYNHEKKYRVILVYGVMPSHKVALEAAEFESQQQWSKSLMDEPVGDISWDRMGRMDYSIVFVKGRTVVHLSVAKFAPRNEKSALSLEQMKELALKLAHKLMNRIDSAGLGDSNK